MQNQLQKPFEQSKKPKVPSQEDTEYIQYSIEFEQTLRELEEHLHESDDPAEIARYTLETACHFYDGDWGGILIVDLDLNLWSPYWWHCKSAEDRTTILMHELETSDFLYRWVKAFRENEPMIVMDADSVHDDYPDEYDLYQRLNIQSVLAVPVRPRPNAIIAIRNPKRHQMQISMLRMLAYVLLAAYNEQNMLDRLHLTFSPESIKSNRDIYISLFGEWSIYTSNGVLKESDFKSPRISRLLTYLLISNKHSVTPLEIQQALWPDDPEDSSKNTKGLIYRLRQKFSLISDEQLVVSTPSGYQFNPDLNITTDYQRFDSFIGAAMKAASVMNKVELLKNAIDLYNGKILSSAEGEHWLMQFATKYHLSYIGAVNELLKQLDSLHSYDLLNQYATRSLSLAPENPRAYGWLIRSLKAQGLDELAANELRVAKQQLSSNEYAELLAFEQNYQEYFL